MVLTFDSHTDSTQAHNASHRTRHGAERELLAPKAPCRKLLNEVVQQLLELLPDLEDALHGPGDQEAQDRTQNDTYRLSTLLEWLMDHLGTTLGENQQDRAERDTALSSRNSTLQEANERLQALTEQASRARGELDAIRKNSVQGSHMLTNLRSKLREVQTALNRIEADHTSIRQSHRVEDSRLNELGAQVAAKEKSLAQREEEIEQCYDAFRSEISADRRKLEIEKSAFKSRIARREEALGQREANLAWLLQNAEPRMPGTGNDQEAITPRRTRNEPGPYSGMSSQSNDGAEALHYQLTKFTDTKDKEIRRLQQELREARAKAGGLRVLGLGKSTSSSLGGGPNSEANEQIHARTMTLRARNRKANEMEADLATSSRRSSVAGQVLDRDHSQESTGVRQTWSIADLRDPEYVPDPPLPVSVLARLRARIAIWDHRRNEWTKPSSDKQRCAQTVTRKKGSEWPNGEGYKCKHCSKTSNLCAVVDDEGNLTLLPVLRAQRAQAPGQDDPRYWI